MPTTDGQTRTLTAAQVRQIDPQGLGASPFLLDIFKKMPFGNDPSSGLDRGLNFSALRFNAPLRLDNKAYVAKMDFRLDEAGMHNLSVRGTLADAKNDEILAQYPGDSPTAQLLNNSRGVSAMYTAVVTPSLVNVVTFGLTRIGLERTGTLGTAFVHDTIDSLQDYTRGFIRIRTCACSSMVKRSPRRRTGKRSRSTRASTRSDSRPRTSLRRRRRSWCAWARRTAS